VSATLAKRLTSQAAHANSLKEPQQRTALLDKDASLGPLHFFTTNRLAGREGIESIENGAAQKNSSTKFDTIPQMSPQHGMAW
jgi:hypothetical protein